MAKTLGFAIQAGAFAKVENAARLTENLQAQGLEATYFKASNGLHKVRFGDFTSREAARKRAESLVRSGFIEDFYVVQPEVPTLDLSESEAERIRESLLTTARSYLDLPYLWGGNSADEGFDCSGLVQSVYRMNGLGLPRSAREQMAAGRPLERDAIQKGDLLFFSPSGKGAATHVALFAGSGLMIHAPRRGQRIRLESIDQVHWNQQYLGARSYL